MGRRRRVEIFFILYLTAIVGFLVISRERDRREATLHDTMEDIFHIFVPPLPLTFGQDTLFWYVDADSAGRVATRHQGFETDVIVRDIGFDDRVAVSVLSVTRNGLLVSPSVAHVGARTAYGGLLEREVAFPIRCVFTTTGTYRVRINAQAERLHASGDSILRYRGYDFPASWLNAEERRRLESNATSLTVVVEDTSLSTVRAVEALRMAVARPAIETAFGYEESNVVTVNHAWFEPSVRIVRGPGRLVAVRTTSRDAIYRWIGTATATRDSVVLAARIDRKAGGKDVATASFTIDARYPILETSLPPRLYAGEELKIGIRVAGLSADTAYAWTLYEVADIGAPVKKDSGRGPIIHYRIPGSFAGKRLRVQATYNQNPYRFIDSRTYTGSMSVFDFTVTDPPAQIAFEPPARAHIATIFQFTAARYDNPLYRDTRPVGRIQDTKVVVKNEAGVVVPTVVVMVGKGRFEFSLEDKEFIRPGGEWIDISIRIGTATVERRVFIERPR